MKSLNLRTMPLVKSRAEHTSAIVAAQNIPWLPEFHTNQQQQERRTDGPMEETRIARVPYFTTSKLSDCSLSVPCRQPTGWSRVKPSQPIQLSRFGRPRSFFLPTLSLARCFRRGVVCREPWGGSRVRTHCANVESRYSHSLCARLCRVGVGLHISDRMFDGSLETAVVSSRCGAAGKGDSAIVSSRLHSAHGLVWRRSSGNRWPGVVRGLARFTYLFAGCTPPC